MEALSALALLAYGVPLVLAAAVDFRTFRIPNGNVAALAAAYPLAAFALGHAAAMPAHFVVAGAVLSAGLLLFALRIMGGGDVKLISAAALWLGPLGAARFVVLTTLLGGVFALAVLVVRRFANSAAERIPYGVPIAAAGLMLARTILLGQ